MEVNSCVLPTASLYSSLCQSILGNVIDWVLADLYGFDDIIIRAKIIKKIVKFEAWAALFRQCSQFSRLQSDLKPDLKYRK